MNKKETFFFSKYCIFVLHRRIRWPRELNALQLKKTQHVLSTVLGVMHYKS